MKLEKREITLNEQDSILDMLHTEKGILRVYESGQTTAQRKECQLVFQSLFQQTEQIISDLDQAKEDAESQKRM